MNLDLSDEIFKKIVRLRAENKKPSFVILDSYTFKELKENRDEFFPYHYAKECDGNEFMGIKVSVVLDTREDTRIVEVV